jgi:hypothetical protein
MAAVLRPRFGSARAPTAFRWWWLPAAGAAVLAIVVFSRIFAGPSFVKRVTVANPTHYQVSVTVGSPGHAEVTALATIEHDTTADIGAVIDQGAEWVFRFSDQGHDGGAVTVSRNQLRALGWRITIPAEVAQRLAAAGAMPSAF